MQIRANVPCSWLSFVSTRPRIATFWNKFIYIHRDQSKNDSVLFWQRPKIFNYSNSQYKHAHVRVYGIWYVYIFRHCLTRGKLKSGTAAEEMNPLQHNNFSRAAHSLRSVVAPQDMLIMAFLNDDKRPIHKDPLFFFVQRWDRTKIRLEEGLQKMQRHP